MAITIEELQNRLKDGPVKVKRYILGGSRLAEITRISGSEVHGSKSDGTKDWISASALENYSFAEPEERTYRSWEMVEGKVYSGSLSKRKYKIEGGAYKVQDGYGNWHNMKATQAMIVSETFTELKPKKITKTVEAWALFDKDGNYSLHTVMPENMCATDKLVKLEGTYQEESYE